MTHPQLCKHCVCPDTTPGLTFNRDGVCSGCVGFRQRRPYDTRAFVRRMEEGFRAVRERPVTYHVLSMFSGGKDSTYLLQLLKRRYGLRPLAFAVIHPFVNDASIRNMDQAAKAVNVDLMKLRIDPDIYRHFMRYSFLHGPRYGLGEMFGCTTCSVVYHKLALTTAIRMGIPFVTDGTDPTQSVRSLPIFVDGQRLRSLYQRSHRLPVDQMFRDALPEGYAGSVYDFDLTRFCDADFPTKMSPFTFMGYDHLEHQEVLAAEGVLRPEESNPATTNCDLLHLFSYVSFKRHNCHPYTTHIAQGLRRETPTLVDQLFAGNHPPLSREEHLQVLQEYRDLLEAVVARPDMDLPALRSLTPLLPFVAARMRSDHLDILLERVNTIHHWADYLGVDLAAI